VSQTAAIFDVDRTILDGMAGNFFFRHLWNSGLVPLLNRLCATAVVAGYRAGLLAEERIVEIGVTVYAGLLVELLKKEAEKCLHEKLAGRLFVEARETIRKHKEQGDLVVLASGSCDFIVSAIANEIGADEFVATSAEVKNGLSTRNILRPTCYGKGKEVLIERFLTDRGIDLANCRLYSDNHQDMSLFRRVAHRHPVNPGAKLAASAKAEGWEILTWNTPTDPDHKVTGTSWPVK
jgi:putative phosphoserine phosphatase / 1-acylglycerol-3-phosphate O-acyltransferase